jgi:uncharacterized membrane protein
VTGQDAGAHLSTDAGALMERQPPAGIMDRGRPGHATPKLILLQNKKLSKTFPRFSLAAPKKRIHKITHINKSNWRFSMLDFTHLHPMLVHFPIALLIIGLLADIVGVFTKREFYSRMALVLLILGTVGLIAAYFSGHQAAEGLMETGPLSMAVETHEEAALLTLWLMIATTLVRLGLTVMRKYSGFVRLIPLAIFIMGVGSMVRTGYYGGELVFKHAAGVQLNIGSFAGEHQESTEQED